ncbi:3-isopropylmalate dehydratase large subunit [Marinobacter sp. M3C]|jgi:3-isopropylmalate/(R)-2-methylmalate dehydratase large subunit|uniref:3-isopropylmalate dehydratase large subunit n=1 Tax=unclassified Marinobacter TaxID=83889 RepID=UPI00200BF674|nr:MULTISPECIES: 3-isopropylmalate dehydratase large subunit [unclassified Marinobacter]MCL1479831.1 3-isopropylmalate dehydratase large subunit [Marinobacter sp.]MCL1486428.1 3-isopropylmalate dehydratase large subunit [Marinobacter sp.]UQG55990.1 3-isopropylmalate dehydratase large subunit [Marinobacter sp. M4C]UQG58617.1 3-isopropylmalate dehydratase large subunit [Marinobacter sp. M3C]UQG64795.1 3-isopropylmalate dehydratase large subunit [Marinobacter sp. M2C]
MAGKTLFDKIWQAHEICQNEEGQSLLWVDLHLAHEGSFHAFNKLAEREQLVRHPEYTICVADHYVPTTSRSLIAIQPKVRNVIQQLVDNSRRHGLTLIGLDDPRQGIVHVVGPEQGITQPGLLMVCGDSHTSTHGALGAFAFGIGASEVAHVLATQTLWQDKPKRMRITINGQLAPGVTAKDIALAWISRLGADGARGYAIEYAGCVVRNLSVEARLTLCNLSIEGGGRCGMIAPDQKTIEYVKGRPYSPKGEALEQAVAYWQTLYSDDDAKFDCEVVLRGEDIEPTVTWGVSPEDALPIGAFVPDPAKAGSPSKAHQIQDSLDYMGLLPGQKLTEISIDRVFIGSCTNARIEDLRAAAAILRGKVCKVPGIVSPGSTLVKAQAEAEGLDKAFIDAGLEWRESGCSMCVGMNGDLIASGERCASTTNRNFKGRQGPGARTHLMSPAMVAAAALTGHLTDIRDILG